MKESRRTRVGRHDETIPLLISMIFHDTGTANVYGMSFGLYPKYTLNR